MTDAELNRAVAEARGAIIGHTEAGDIPARWPDVANDPAAWGALFVWITTQRSVVLLGYGGAGTFVADVNGCVGRDSGSPGRALALAFLQAVQP